MRENSLKETLIAVDKIAIKNIQKLYLENPCHPVKYGGKNFISIVECSVVEYALGMGEV